MQLVPAVSGTRLGLAGVFGHPVVMRAAEGARSVKLRRTMYGGTSSGGLGPCGRLLSKHRPGAEGEGTFGGLVSSVYKSSKTTSCSFLAVPSSSSSNVQALPLLPDSLLRQESRPAKARPGKATIIYPGNTYGGCGSGAKETRRREHHHTLNMLSMTRGH